MARYSLDTLTGPVEDGLLTLRDARARKGITITEAAKKLGISTVALHQRETDGMRLELFLKHCEALGLDPSTINPAFVKPERAKKTAPKKEKKEEWDDKAVFKQSRQCKTCEFRINAFERNTDNKPRYICNYLCTTGHCRDQGTGAGDCRSYRRDRIWTK